MGVCCLIYFRLQAYFHKLFRNSERHLTQESPSASCKDFNMPLILSLKREGGFIQILDKARKLPSRWGAGHAGSDGCSTRPLHPAEFYLAPLQWAARRKRCQTSDTWCLNILRNVSTCGFHCTFVENFSKLKMCSSHENTKSLWLGNSNNAGTSI